MIRRCRIRIDRLHREDGDSISSWRAIGDELVRFYSALYTSNNPSFHEDLEGLMQPEINDQENEEGTQKMSPENT